MSAELDEVYALGLRIGWGYVMQLAERCWREHLEAIDDPPGGEHTVGPAAALLVACHCSVDERSRCDWCCGVGRVTRRVRRAMDERTLDEEQRQRFAALVKDESVLVDRGEPMPMLGRAAQHIVVPLGSSLISIAATPTGLAELGAELSAGARAAYELKARIFDRPVEALQIASASAYRLARQLLGTDDVDRAAVERSWQLVADLGWESDTRSLALDREPNDVLSALISICSAESPDESLRSRVLGRLAVDAARDELVQRFRATQLLVRLWGKQ